VVAVPVVGGELDALGDPVERDDERGAAHPDQEAVDDREGQREPDADRGALAAYRIDLDAARRAATFRRTTSMPTPRPERLEIVSAVEKPGSKMSSYTSASVNVAPGGTSPRSTALARMRSRSSPRPSSETSMTMFPASW
jgi:hypothetical protein